MTDPGRRDFVLAAAQRIALCVVAALIAASLFALLLSASPVRFDRKAFRRYLPSNDISRADAFVLVSRDASWEAGHAQQYTMNLLPYPPPHIAEWLVLEEQEHPGDWSPTGVLSRSGAMQRLDGRPLPPLPPETMWLTLDAATTTELRRRRPDAEVTVLTFDSAPLLERPAWRSSSTTFLRFGLLCLAVALFASAATTRGISFPLALPLFISAYISIAYLVGLFLPFTIPLTVATMIVAGIALHFFRPAAVPSIPGRTMKTAALTAAVVLTVAAAVVRLDFDGDMLTHWLPIGRTIHFEGSHHVSRLKELFSAGHRVAYPPAIPTILASCMWVGDSARDALHFGSPLNAAVAAYRVLVGALQASVVLATLFAVLRIRQRGWRLAFLIGLIVTAALLAGKPAAGEVILVPLLAAALLLIEDTQPIARGAGLFLAASLLLVKADAILVLPLLVLPWYLAHARPSVRDALWSAAGLVAPMAFRWELARHDVNTNFAFVQVDVQTLVERLPSLGLIVREVVSSISNSLIAPALLLTVMMMSAALARGLWREAVVPASVLAFCAAVAGLYLFTAHDLRWHVSTSYVRVASAAAVATFLHAIHFATDVTSRHVR